MLLLVRIASVLVVMIHGAARELLRATQVSQWVLFGVGILLESLKDLPFGPQGVTGVVTEHGIKGCGHRAFVNGGVKREHQGPNQGFPLKGVLLGLLEHGAEIMREGFVKPFGRRVCLRMVRGRPTVVNLQGGPQGLREGGAELHPAI